MGGYVRRGAVAEIAYFTTGQYYLLYVIPGTGVVVIGFARTVVAG